MRRRGAAGCILCVSALLMGGGCASKHFTTAARRRCEPLLDVAHRGSGAGIGENTLRSVGVARRALADYVETDIRVTRDGVPVVMHDSTVDRTTDGHGAVNALSWRQIRRLREKGDGERVPTERSFVTAVGRAGLRLLLEIKTPVLRSDIPTILRTIGISDMWTRTVVHSFSLPVLREVRRVAPTVAPIGAQGQLPRAWLIGGLTSAAIATAQQAKIQWVEPSVGRPMSRGLVALAHRLGLHVVPWVADSRGQWRVLKRLGVDGVITDDPAQLRAWASCKS